MVESHSGKLEYCSSFRTNRLSSDSNNRSLLLGTVLSFRKGLDCSGLAQSEMNQAAQIRTQQATSNLIALI